MQLKNKGGGGQRARADGRITSLKAPERVAAYNQHKTQPKPCQIRKLSGCSFFFPSFQSAIGKQTQESVLSSCNVECRWVCRMRETAPLIAQ